MNLKKFSTCKKSTACGTALTSLPQNNKGPWTEQEDKKLINLVEKYGAEKWSFISSHFPERIGKQCRERWFNHLCPTVNKTAWSKEEEWILFILHNKIGNKWSQLCKYLPGRTDNTIKNHWNSTMKKRIDNLKEEYENMIKGKNEEEIEQIQKDILDKYKTVVEQENQKFYSEKMKNYEKFKNTTMDNKQSMYKLKKILLFRTHSKKVKRRGRKKKCILGEEKTTSSIKNYINTTNNNNTDNNSTNKTMKNAHIKKNKIKKEKSKKKKYGTPKNKKSKRKIGDIFIDENKQYSKNINIISSPIHKFIITKGDIKDSRKKSGNSNISINNNINIINNINNENPILLNNYNNINSESAPISFNNNYIVYTNPININNSIYNNILKSHSHKRRIKLEIDEKNNIKDLSLLTPLKINDTGTPNFNITEANKILYKNDSNNILEKSAFNKPIIGEVNCPYSNIKTHLYFTSSIKKPIKIISEEKNQSNINILGAQNNQNIFINNDQSDSKNSEVNMENITPNKIIDCSEKNGSNIILKFNNNLVYNSSNKSKECLNSSGLNMNMNNPYDVFYPDKNATPFKTSNANLDKMFFSNLNSKNEKI